MTRTTTFLALLMSAGVSAAGAQTTRAPLAMASARALAASANAASATATDTVSFASQLVIPAAASRFRGVDLVSTGRSFTVRIQSGLIGDGEPLYEIDGAPAASFPDGIDWFKPTDITRLEVRKTAAELSAYGQRGANGVIVITTNANYRRS